jgi:hypothetical protein
MSSIRATFNTSSKEWFIQKISLKPTFTDIEFIVMSEQEYTVFDGVVFKFGYSLKFANEVVIQQNFPSTGVVYESLSRYPVEIIKVELLPDRNYTLEIYAILNNERFETTSTFLTGLPDKPYPSWSWNGTEWVAPIAKPLEHAYEWDEGNQLWSRIVLPTERI